VSDRQWGYVQNGRIVRTPRPMIRRFVGGFLLGAVSLYLICAFAAVWWPLSIPAVIIVIGGFRAFQRYHQQ
jgi:hypothetical protein